MLLSWEFSAVVLKVLFYLAVCVSIGGLATLALTPKSPIMLKYNTGYAILGATIALVTVWLQFAQQIGAFNEAGLSGIFDRDIALMLLDSNVGLGSYLRSLALILLLVAAVVSYWRSYLTKLSLVIGGLGAMLLAYSYSVIGHVAELEGLAMVAISIHLIAICWWLGSLVPLRQATKVFDSKATQQLMVRFGHVAQLIIALLLVSGGYLLVELIGSVERVLTTPYGQALTIKLLLVTTMLGLGALNKLRLVPQLSQVDGAIKLTRAINTEILLALAILTITAYFTTVIGPGY